MMAILCSVSCDDKGGSSNPVIKLDLPSCVKEMCGTGQRYLLKISLLWKLAMFTTTHGKHVWPEYHMPTSSINSTSRAYRVVNHKECLTELVMLTFMLFYLG